jgi:hypothetical protein
MAACKYWVIWSVGVDRCPIKNQLFPPAMF